MARKPTLSEKRADAGSKGGQAKVPKGFATLTKKQRSAIAKKAAAARWGK